MTVRYLLLSDMHGNIDAFEAVLADADGDWDRVIVLGDLVGYGAEPNLVIDKVRSLDPLTVIRGNHDKAACGLDDGSQFNQVARLAAAWTGQFLTPGNRTYLRELPMLFIVSDVELRPAPTDVEANSEARPRVTIERAGGVKCERCWRYVPTVSSDPQWAGLCSRCQDALSRGDQAA